MNNNNLKAVRLKRGMSISELARRSGVSRVTVTNIENGKANPTVKTAESICKALDKNLNDIFL